jgi:hypothetical protein
MPGLGTPRYLQQISLIGRAPALLGVSLTLLGFLCLSSAAMLLWHAPLPILDGRFNAQQLLVAGTGFTLTAFCFWYVRRQLMHPWQRMTQLLKIAHDGYAQELGELALGNASLNDMAHAISQLAAHLQHTHAQRRLLEHELERARQLLASHSLQQQTIIATTNRELIEQYQSVVAYAHYLDEYIQRDAADAQLRYDFDDVCESGFNLKLIAQSLEMLRYTSMERVAVSMNDLLQQTMLALAPALDRRSMTLSTLGMEKTVIAFTDLGVIAHVVWMMLLGSIRYAAAESSLRLRCLEVNDGQEVLLSMVLSELAPGALSPSEREAHLARQLEHLSAPMFAETIRLHGNIQLAEMLLARLDGQILVHPITAYACEICLYLPAAKKE